MREMTLKEVKNVSLDILKDVDKICGENGITYFLGYGTLLGAVRHKGFIPWDNDIDIWVPIDELETFWGLIEEKSKYELLSFYGSKKKFPDGFAKISNPETKVINYASWAGVADRGVAVDVFPLIGCKKNIVWRFGFLYNNLMVRKSIEYQLGGHRKTGSLKKHLIRIFLYMDNLLHNQNYWSVKLYKKMQRVKNSGWLGFPIKGLNGKDIYRAEDFSSVEYVEFEGFSFPAPVGWHDILSIRYGDYMTPPPEEERVTHKDSRVYWQEQIKQDSVQHIN